MNRIFSKSFILILTVMFIVSCSSKKQEQQRPNILFIMSDDHAYQAISAYGSGLNHTPNIDRLASEGIQFEQEKLDAIFKRLELSDLKGMRDDLITPIDVFIIADVSNDGKFDLISRKWHEPLCNILDMFKYEKEAIERDKFYQDNNLLGNENRYDKFCKIYSSKFIRTCKRNHH